MEQTTPILQIPKPKPQGIFADLQDCNKKIYGPIKLRARKNKSGIYSLYLHYRHKGRQEYETLNMYITGKVNYHKDDLKTVTEAIGIRNSRWDDMKDDKRDKTKEIRLKVPESEIKLIDYFEKKMKPLRRRETMNTWECYNNVLNYLKKHKIGKTGLVNITDLDCEIFYEFLRNNLHPNSAIHYLRILKIVLNRAVKEKLIPSNPANLVSTKKHGKKPKIEFVEEFEIRKLHEKPIENKHQIVKDAFIFSSFTGLRLSDVQRLKFTDVVNGYIVFDQEKTDDENRIPLMGTSLNIFDQQKRINKKGFVFQELRRYENLKINNALKKWIKSAGIKRNISYHCSRHSFAIMLLRKGVDIFTVSKLLGHHSISMTEKYLHIVDAHREEAVSKLPVL